MDYKSIVIGSSSGIGLAITQELLKRNHQVTGISRREVSEKNIKYNHLELDVTSDLFINSIKNHLNLEDYNNLIFCVGKNNIKLAKDLKKIDIVGLLETNLIPALLISSEFAKSRNKSIASSILFIGSIWSSFGLKGRSIYGATKSALAGYTKHLSAELSPLNCLVNVLSPGFTDTPLTEKSINDPKIKNVLPRVDRNCLLKTNEIATHSIMLIAPYNKCITGQEIFSDGGFSAHG
tara:strand:- start:4907 stop:5614 length:708 start_codon:yes stop_codon:yes gene_type:complete